MLEYVFFDEGIRDKFVEELRAKGVDVTTSDDAGCLAEVPEDLDDKLADEVDYLYEKLLQETAELLEESEGVFEKNVMGVMVALEDGIPCTIRLDPDLVARLLNCISMEELRDLAQVIAEGVQNPDNRPLCHT